MMITTKGGARFHSNTFASGLPSAATAQVIGKATSPNSIHGTKRLASCREELEQSWQGGTQDFHCVSNYGASEDDVVYGSGRIKRRRTLQPSDSNEDMMDCSFVKGNRISPSNRPTHVHNTESQVKAGWYEGEVDTLGARHGKGITKHDDGTEYEGPYVKDIMEGPQGRYKFPTTRHLIPNPRHNGSHLHRQIEKSFEGNFKNNVPHGVGMIITKTVDCAPQVLGSAPLDIRSMEVMHDVGMHKNSAVGEGVRIIYSTTNVDGRSTLEKTCYRLMNGETTNLKLAHDYAAWILQCMGVKFPLPSPSII
mmetsp:Transcript_5846/g.13336  ORF Transcript_5846/g.13336 Transcript_5846/m.13336 type:complete len:308 (+) Transcript_5846:424-1347(+)|eukprot:CAMPEP_0172328252 /NCGR_PEP_ID=MMETSP1058-20130122/60254_1 /TAXON_ID=83371 /ORGANISM="Detonula confervacea, Strain CCMP 353" /LENGTH=307 /DNA_ID=CAMNT_0013045359 /DNA_START=431 /DNA_END=1354 /DNA_ORIENTATION=-